MNPCELLVGLGARLALPPLSSLAWALVVDDGVTLSLRQKCPLFVIAGCDAPQTAARDVGCWTHTCSSQQPDTGRIVSGQDEAEALGQIDGAGLVASLFGCFSSYINTRTTCARLAL